MPQPQPFVAERRRNEREARHAAATLSPAAGDSLIQQQAEVRNLSMGGVGLRCTHRVKRGDVYRITFDNGTLYLNARIRITRCIAMDEGFDVGATFC